MLWLPRCAERPRFLSSLLISMASFVTTCGYGKRRGKYSRIWYQMIWRMEDTYDVCPLVAISKVSIRHHETSRPCRLVEKNCQYRNIGYYIWCITVQVAPLECASCFSIGWPWAVPSWRTWTRLGFVADLGIKHGTGKSPWNGGFCGGIQENHGTSSMHIYIYIYIYVYRYMYLYIYMYNIYIYICI